MRLRPKYGFAHGAPFKAAFVVCLLSLVSTASTQTSIFNISYGRSWPRSIVVDSARQLVFVDGLSGLYPPGGFSFGVIDSSSGALISVLALNGTAGKLALDEGTGTVYAAGNDSLAVFDSQSRTFVRTIELKLPVFSIAFDGSTGYLLLTTGHSVVQLDPESGKILRSVVAGNSAEGMAVDPSRGEVFVANYLSASVSVLRSSDLATLATVTLPPSSYPAELAVDQGRGILYATTDGRAVARISLSNYTLLGSLMASASDSNGTYAVAIDSSRSRLFVAAEPGEIVTELDASTGVVISNFALDSAVFEMAVDQQSGRLYVTNYHQVTVITPPESSRGGQPLLQPGELAALVGLAAALTVGFVVWRVTPSGGRRDDSPSRLRRAPSL